MCTLIVAWRVFDGTPIVAAANRDEALGRPSRSPSVLDRDPLVVAPQDEEAGGTWIGYNEHGLFVGVTNRSAEIDGDRSRGLLVRDALSHESSADALGFVRDELAKRQYAGFNLFLADSDEATILQWDGVLETTPLDPGYHVVVNEGMDYDAPKSKRILHAVLPDLGENGSVGEWRARVKTVLRDHDIGACVHGDGYGTRSSSIVAIDSAGVGTYEFADGPPCETAYRSVEGHI
ncbi:NRDE family protein [Haladaptatus pallidirubidus]|uniref:NRDE family protein n=1 Tax=Haladaptatus pallidirubidus TaxID=1008152 RepID=A0AAV3UKM2_9EURY|nr:NRDE family protein [Haladaptatus pallidirubidus]